MMPRGGREGVRPVGDHATCDLGILLSAVVALFDAIEGREIAVTELELARSHVLAPPADQLPRLPIDDNPGSKPPG
jgi:hypothetical protein